MSGRTCAEFGLQFVTRPSCLLGWGVAVVVIASGGAASGESPVPWECSNYSREAQTRCMNAFIELQQERIGRLEDQLQAQQETIDQLKSQADRQAATATELRQQLAQRPPVTTSVVPMPYAYTYAYPPVGLGFYWGRPWIYGPPYYYHPYWGPRFYGRWGRRW